MEKKTLTVFTPTFNRAYCLHQLYKSLCRQTSSDFLWLIIDDGSTDNTKEIVSSWINEDRVNVVYIYQENQGMHGAHNTAYNNIITELNVCIDSDDFMPDNAVEIIIEKWKTVKNDFSLAGIIGYDVYKNLKTVGTDLPQKVSKTTLSDLYYKYGVKGDKKLVLKTSIVKKFPAYPLFQEEKFVPLHTLYLMIDQEYELACLNEPLCVVEYMPDGSSLNIFKQYKRHPRGFRYSRIIELKYLKNVKTRVIKTLHLISSTLFIGDYKFFKGNPAKFLTLICLPLGILFHLYIKHKIKNSQ
ncbi:glycosyltransferase family 2 protein [Tenacibaculum crassostreae]|uniref:glycosyltransferase family 2 protein n=1 Tax=Tenacibaculum crassostreae TaxID=502683 RepID=UPI003894FBF8